MIETLTKVFVGSVNLQSLIDRNENRADDDEREGLAEIVLDESDPALVGLARHGKERDRAGLGREDGEPDRSPTDCFISLEVLAEVRVLPGPPQSVKRDRENRRDQDEVVDPVHENRRVKA